MTKEIVEMVDDELKKDTIEGLEELAGWWIENEYMKNDQESRDEYEKRKSIVLPMIIDNKLKRYEEEYEICN